MLARSVRSNLLFNSARWIHRTPSVFSTDRQPGPSKQTMLAIDWQLEGLLPKLFKGSLGAFFQRMSKDVEFDDHIFNYKIKDPYNLNIHLLKVRAYYRYKSPYNSVEYLGSTYFEGEEMLTVLWRLTSLKSSFLRYFPKFVTGKAPEYQTVDGALDIYVGPDDRIYKMINRPVTPKDVEQAQKFSELKKESAKEVEQKERDLAEEVAKKIAEEKRSLK